MTQNSHTSTPAKILPNFDQHMDRLILCVVLLSGRPPGWQVLWRATSAKESRLLSKAACIIPTHGRPDHLSRSLDSALQHIDLMFHGRTRLQNGRYMFVLSTPCKNPRG